LCLRVQRSGFRSFKFVYSVNGQPRWYHIGGIPLADARRIADRLRVAVAEGRDPHGERKAQRNADTFAEVADAYLEHAKARNKSWPQARKLVVRFALPAWGGRPAKSVSRSDVKALLGRIRSPSVCNGTLAALSAVFSWAVREEIVTANPCTGIERHSMRSRERVLSDTELPLLWKALDAMGSAEARALQTILLTGQRPGEVSRMRAEHVVDGVWTLPGAPQGDYWPGTKNGRTHRVWLPQTVRDIVNGSGSGFVFGNMRLDLAMQKACRAAGITDRITPHDLRRSAATLVTRLGFGRAAMDRLLNHVANNVSDIYDRHNYENQDRVIVEKISAHVIGLVEIEQRRTGAGVI
jgi:integrase